MGNLVSAVADPDQSSNDRDLVDGNPVQSNSNMIIRPIIGFNNGLGRNENRWCNIVSLRANLETNINKRDMQ